MKIQMFNVLALVCAAAAPGLGQGIITTVAGTSTCCNSSDGILATNEWLAGLGGVAVDKQGNLYLWDGASGKVRKVNGSTGIITTFAGNGTFGYTGDGGPATSAGLFSSGSMLGLAVDPSGNVYIADGNNNAIRKVNTQGFISTVAGNGSPGFSGDGGLATKAQLQYPTGIALDSQGNLYISDNSNNRVRKVNAATGIITTFAGNGNVVYSGDNVQAATTAVVGPEGLAIDSADNVYISEITEARVRKVAPNGIITTYAGQTTKTRGFSGDGGPATAATLSGPIGLAIDPAGNLYIVDSGNNRIRKVTAAGTISTYAGISGNSSTPLGDGGPATSAFLGVALDAALDTAGDLFVVASAGSSHRLRKITPGAGLSTSPASLSFAYTIGGTNPPTQSLAVTVTGGSPSFSATASSTTGTWLSVSPAGGTAPTSLTVSVDPARLPGGVYQGAVTLTPTGGTAQSVLVTMTVTGAGAPVITAGGIVNATGYQTKLAPDTVFVIFGSGMGPASLASASAPSYPTTLGGTSVTFTPSAGGAAIDAKMVYTTSGQIAGLLPSSIAPGTYAVRVTYNSLTSAPQNVTVVARSFGIATSNSAGSGTAQATIGNVNGGLSLTRFTSGSLAYAGYNWTLTPAHPGDTIVLWGTGGGADSANDTGGTSGDQTKAGNFSVSVSSRAITPVYAGASSGYPGLWQVNFTLPSDIALDCFATVQVTAAGESGNAVTVPIAAGGQNACSDSQLTAAALASLDAGGKVVLGGLGIGRTTNTFSQIPTPGAPTSVTTASQEAVSGGFSQYTAAEYAAIYAGVKIGACTINDRTAPATTPSPATPDGYLDAGATLPFSGPGVAAGAALAIYSTSSGPLYTLGLANGTIVNGGKYTLSGSGGKGVGAFNGSVTFPPAFTVTGWDTLSTIDRSKPLVLNWTGGVDQVLIIIGTSSVVGKDASNTNIIRNVTVNCQVPAAPGTYTVPSAVLGYLLPESIDAASLAKGSGTLAVETTTSQPFTAPLLGGATAAFTGLSATSAVSKDLIVQ